MTAETGQVLIVVGWAVSLITFIFGAIIYSFFDENNHE